MVALSTVMLGAAACGGAAPQEAASVGSVAVQEKVTVTPDTAATPFALRKGTYRVSWSTTGCKSIAVTLAGDNGFSKEKKSTLPKFSWIVLGVPDGTYTATQTDPACADWQLAIERVGGA